MNQEKIELLADLFAKTMRLHRAAMHGRMAEEGKYIGQPQILFELSKHDHVSQKDLAKALHLSPATITITLTRMQKTGLVCRTGHPTDKRIQHVMLTDKGRDLLKKASGAIMRMMSEMLADIGEDDLDALIRVMAKAVENLSNMSGHVSFGDEEPSPCAP